MRRSLPLIFIIFSWVLCAVLQFRTAAVLHPGNVQETDWCLKLFGYSCDTALKTRITFHLKYPLASIGLVYFGLAGLLWVQNKRLTDGILLYMLSAGVGVSIFYVIILIRGHMICPACYLIHASHLITWLLVWLVIKRRSLLQLSFYLTVVLLLMGAGVGDYFLLRNTLKGPGTLSASETIQSWQHSKTYAFYLKNAATLGDTTAKVIMIVFSSFQCPSCKEFTQSIKQLKSKYGDELCVVFKNFPLSEKCNSRLIGDAQPGACDAAKAALAAKQQGKFWNFHDRFFSTGLSADDNSLKAVAKEAGLNMELWEADRNSKETETLLSNDISEANNIGINATPSIFINGRQVQNAGVEILKAIIEKAMSQ